MKKWKNEQMEKNVWKYMKKCLDTWKKLKNWKNENNGKYETIAPSHGEQFFYHDFQVDLCPSKEINLGVDLDALDMLEKRNPKPKED